MVYNIRVFRVDGKPVSLVSLMPRLAAGLDSRVIACYSKDDTGNVDSLKAELTIAPRKPSDLQYEANKILKIIKGVNRSYMFELMAANHLAG